jgi:hypothetical protein
MARASITKAMTDQSRAASGVTPDGELARHLTIFDDMLKSALSEAPDWEIGASVSDSCSHWRQHSFHSFGR